MYNKELKKDLEKIILQKDINIISGNISGYSIDIESESELTSYVYYNKSDQRNSDINELLSLFTK
jgi:hypothetical protein